MSLSDVLELYVCIILTVEYLWGRPDVVIKNEEKQRKRLRPKKSDEIPLEKEMD